MHLKRRLYSRSSLKKEIQKKLKKTLANTKSDMEKKNNRQKEKPNTLIELRDKK